MTFHWVVDDYMRRYNEKRLKMEVKTFLGSTRPRVSRCASHPWRYCAKKLDKYKLKTSEELRSIPSGRTVCTANIGHCGSS